MKRYTEQDFSPWWFLVAPVLWGAFLTLAFAPVIMEHHHAPGVRHAVLVEMEIAP